MDDQWIQKQFENVNLKDTRLQKRAVIIAKACAEHPSALLPGRFEDWAGLKAAYRFCNNPKATHQKLQQPHYENVLHEARSCEETVLFIQDGSELLFNSHPWTNGFGPTADSSGNGLMFHSCLVAKTYQSQATETLGLAYQEVWIRPEKKTINAPKESEVWLRTLDKLGAPQKNWVSVGDRGNDIYDFLQGASSKGWNFVVRARHNRKIDRDKQTRLFDWIREMTSKSQSKLYLRARGKEFSGEINLEITWAKTKLFSPCKAITTLKEEITCIRVWSPDRPKLEWMLITNLPIESEKEAEKVIEIYRSRWLIEEYHKALKTGCRIEQNQFKHSDRILVLFGLIGVIATQLLAMREQCRLIPMKPAREVMPGKWIILLEKRLKIEVITVRDFWRGLARLGGFIGRKSDGAPGWLTICRGYTRLQDMLLGISLLETCG